MRLTEAEISLKFMICLWRGGRYPYQDKKQYLVLKRALYRFETFTRQTSEPLFRLSVNEMDIGSNIELNHPSELYIPYLGELMRYEGGQYQKNAVY